MSPNQKMTHGVRASNLGPSGTAKGTLQWHAPRQLYLFLLDKEFEKQGWLCEDDDYQITSYGCRPGSYYYWMSREPEWVDDVAPSEKPDALNAALIADGVVLERPAPSKHAERKARPTFRGVLGYFPDALAEVANVSRVGNDQHNAGQPIHWAYGKSMDHGDCILRHQADYDETDDDGLLHAAKVAWRALAQLQTLLEQRDPKLHAKQQAQRERAAKGER